MKKQYADQLLNLALDTIGSNKQALVFCNTKRGAESQAEKISQKVRLGHDQQVRCVELSEAILSALESPTKQCKRLAAIVKNGCAFHHAGLNYKQREIIEDAFRANEIFIICSTPTLAMGLDMPAFRSIIRDVKRFSAGKGWGMKHIPVLEFEQMAGRAGRPGKEDFGEAILVAQDAAQAEELKERYLHGEPEEIFSKLAVEPVLRTYLLSLIATGFIKDRKSMYAFFDKTFYATQYADLHTLHQLLDKMLVLLEEWEFVRVAGSEQMGVVHNEFASAADLVKEPEPTDERFRATPVGVRVAELYLDPFTAAFLITHLQKATAKEERLSDPALLHLLSSTLEIRPTLRPRTKDYDVIDEWLIEYEDYLLVAEPTQYSYEYDDWLASVKTTMFFLDWINEAGEERLLEDFGVRPGELKAKTDIADWLLYSCEELCKLLSFQMFLAPLAKMRVRLQYGVKEELLKLMRFKGIGKKRARTLYRNGVKLVSDVKSAEFSTLAQLIGPGVAKNLKEQVGEQVDPEKVKVKLNKRKGQKNLGDW